MDINARINWMPGMEITAQTFLGLAEHWDFRQQLALRAALGSSRMGLLPKAPFNCNGIFVNNRLEIDHFVCMALLPSGRIVNADEDVQVAIPLLFGERYYLTIGFGNDQTEFEKEGVPFVKPHYVFSVNTQEEVEAGDLFPVMRFVVKDSVFAADSDFIPPCLLLTEDDRFKQYITKYVEQLTLLANHSNMQDFILLTQEIAQAIDYYIITPNTEQSVEIATPTQIDIQLWLQWLDDYMSGAATILDGVVLEDNTIDYETLLAQAKKELYDKLHPELIEKLLNDMKEELHAEIKQQTETLTTYINETLKTAILEQLTAEMDNRTTQYTETMNQKFDEMGKTLFDTLYDKLYFELFDKLFNALYVPEPEEKDFVPLI